MSVRRPIFLRHLAAVARLTAGWTMIALGLLGLVLPILQGILFLVIGLALLAPFIPFVDRLQQRLYRRMPRAKAWIERNASRFRRAVIHRRKGPLPPRLVFYVTAHGYGHGVRTCDVLRAFRRRHPDVPVTVVSDLPESFFRARVPDAEVAVRRDAFDLGLVQKDALRPDLDATLERLIELRRGARRRAALERAYLRAVHAGLVVADIPGLPLRAAADIGLPAYAVGNFSWDWIYEPWIERDARWRDIVDWFRGDYAAADGVFRLPFSGDMSAFRRGEDVPLLTEPCASRRAEIAAAFDIPAGERWALIGFTSLRWSEDALRRLNELPDTRFLVMAPADFPGRAFHRIDRARFSFSEALASCDVVLSKPGYGIVSECVAHRKPLVYAEREEFRETPVLVEGIRRNLASAPVSIEELTRGDLGPALEHAVRQEVPAPSIPLGGAALLADRFARLLADR
jgi:hypothetical protein